MEAIEKLFSAVRPDTGMAFVVIQHLSPDYKSLMVEILSKKTEMTVLRAESGMKVQANHVYLIIPNNNLTIFHGKLLLHTKEPSKTINLPIDIFLRSLAEDQTDKAGAIILSGTGSDGMRGLRSVKESGGFVLVQNEESAQFDGMPRSAISTGLADFISPPEDMAEHLLKFTKQAVLNAEDYTKKLLTDDECLTRIFAMIREKHKVDFTFYKMSTIIRRIKRRMTVNTVTDLIEYVRFMENNPREITTLYKELLIGVTNFYRDKEAFQLLEEKYLPELLQRVAGKDIRFWVAGCSTGEEAYTLAIVCRECIDNLDLNINVKIFATDVDEEAIAKASNGLYPESIAADLSQKVLSKYFFRKDESYQVARSIREMIVFAQHDLTKDPPFTNVDFISCRNLLIYLQPVLQQKTFEFFNFSLNPQGILFLGSSESIGEMMDYFEPLEHKWKIFRSRGRKKQLHTVHQLDTSRLVSRAKSNYFFRPTKEIKTHELERVLERFLNVLHEGFIPLSIIVNDQLELVHVVGDISKYFKLPIGSFTPNIISMAQRELSIPLSTGLQKAFQTKQSISYSNIIFRVNDEKVNIKLHIIPLPEKRGQEPLAAVLIHETERYPSEGKESVSKNFDVSVETEQRIYDLEQELQFNRESLQATIEELETSNEELQATNEEIQRQLSEKETLLREVHHRVKNNIATIEGLLSLQVEDSYSLDVKVALQEAITRVQSIRVLYDKLLISKEYDVISIRNYVKSLLDSLIMVFDPGKTITLETHITDFEVDAKKAISLGIIINELLTNVFKYAFKDRGPREVSVTIDSVSTDKDKDEVTLIIQDNGVGIDQRVLENKSPGFGLTIVKMLVEQLGGTYTIVNENGTKSVVKFSE